MSLGAGLDPWAPVRSRQSTPAALGFVVLLSLVALTTQTCCPNDCTGNGDCHTADCVCHCIKGFAGADCSRRVCPYGAAWADHAIGFDNAHNLAECSNKGSCDRTTGICLCDMMFTGLSCNRMLCPNDCSGHGHCQSMSYYAAKKDPGEGVVHKYTDIWDANMIYGCMCDPPYFGEGCLSRGCPTGDDPLTGSVDDQNGVQFDEKQIVTCRATNGRFTLLFRGEATAYISYNEKIASFISKFEALSTITAASIRYAGATTTACTPQGNDITIIFTQQHGDLPLIVPNKAELIHSSAIQDPELTVTEIVKGNKEDSFCSDRGSCDPLTGYCTCGVGYDTSNGLGVQGTLAHNRGDCGWAKVSITTCPGEIACSGHGVCRNSPTYRCLCSKGWQGYDCAQRTCPFETAWFDRPISDNRAHQWAECSNMGTCERSKGECVCTAGFQGHACERMSCPGSPECNGHGKCLTIAHLAELAEKNGDVTPYTYGTIPNKPSTWDFGKVMGCKCDEGYKGFDCSLRSCPVGDDPRTQWYTSGKHRPEIQALTCKVDAGEGSNDGSRFRLSFRCGKYNNVQISTRNKYCTTEPISWKATEAEVKRAIENLKTIGGGQHQHQKFNSGRVDVHFTKKWYIDQHRRHDPSGHRLDGLPVRMGEKVTHHWWKKRCNTPDTCTPLDVACTTDGSNVIVVTFKSEPGDLPALQPGYFQYPNSMAITVETDGKGPWSQRGTTETKVCSGRGLCDESTGNCVCVSGYATSDGFGNLGARRDCGHRLEFSAGAAAGF